MSVQSIIVLFSGTVLLIASSLKFSVACHGCPEFCVLGSCSANVTLALIEVVLGMIVLSAKSNSMRRIVAIVSYTFLFVAAAVMSYFGGKSCNCFGHLVVSPIYVLFADAFLLILLLWSDSGESIHVRQISNDKKWFSLSRSIFATAIFFSGIFFGKMVQNEINQVGYIDLGGAVILQPKLWKNKEYPKGILRELGLEIDDGRKIRVLFVRGNCEHCIQLFQGAKKPLDNGLVVLVLPPLGETSYAIKQLGYANIIYNGTRRIIIDVPWLVHFDGSNVISSGPLSNSKELDELR